MLRSLFLMGVALQAFIPLATADSVSLSDFQRLPIGLLVPLTCSSAYRKTVPNCGVSDFANGAACSASCITGLEQISLSVNTNCPGVIADSNSLLGQIFQGQLVSLLCPNSRKSTTSTSLAQTTPPATKTTPPATAPVTTSLQQTTTTPAATKESIVIPPASISISTISVRSSAVSGIGDETSAPSVPATSTLDGLGSLPSSTTSSTRQRATATPKASTGSSAQAQQAAALANTGGGSLFDVSEVGSKSDTTRILPGLTSLLCASLCSLCIGLWVGR